MSAVTVYARRLYRHPDGWRCPLVVRSYIRVHVLERDDVGDAYVFGVLPRSNDIGSNLPSPRSLSKHDGCVPLLYQFTRCVGIHF